MKITKFKLVDGGYGGISVNYEGSRIKDGSSILYERIEKVKVPVSPELSIVINRLKVFLLRLTNHWDKRLDVYINENFEIVDLDISELSSTDLADYNRSLSLFRNTEITGVSTSDGGILITGKIESAVKIPVAINSPLVTEDYDWIHFEDLRMIINSLFKKIAFFIESDKLLTMDPKKYLVEKAKVDVEEVEGLDPVVAKERMIKHLEDLGYIILDPENYAVETEVKEKVDVKKETEEINKETREKIEMLNIEQPDITTPKNGRPKKPESKTPKRDKLPESLIPATS